MQTIGNRLAEIRKGKKIKQTELAEKLNVSQQVISNIERGLQLRISNCLKRLQIFIAYRLMN